MNQWIAGALGGFAATLPMTIVMEVLHHAHPRDRVEDLPPKKITRRMARAVGIEDNLDEETLHLTSLASHFAYGATCGALYPLARKMPAPRVASGVALGLAVWVGSYLGWLPAAGIMRPATKHRPERNLLMIAAHIVWGAVLALVAEALMDSPRRRAVERHHPAMAAARL